MSRKNSPNLLDSTRLCDVPIVQLPPCGFLKNCAGYRCSRQPKPRNTIFDDLIESGAAEAFAAFENDARTAHAAALAGSFDPDDLAGLDLTAVCHALATRKDIDPNCNHVKQLYEATKGEVWTEFAESNLKRLAGVGKEIKKPHPRKRKVPEDPALRPNLFRDFGVALTPSSPRPGKLKTKRLANFSTE